MLRVEVKVCALDNSDGKAGPKRVELNIIESNWSRQWTTYKVCRFGTSLKGCTISNWNALLSITLPHVFPRTKREYHHIIYIYIYMERESQPHAFYRWHTPNLPNNLQIGEVLAIRTHIQILKAGWSRDPGKHKLTHVSCIHLDRYGRSIDLPMYVYVFYCFYFWGWLTLSKFLPGRSSSLDRILSAAHRNCHCNRFPYSLHIPA